MFVARKTIGTVILTIGAMVAVAACVQESVSDLGSLPAKAKDISPLREGDRAPAFTVRTVADEPFLFDPDALERPTVLISVRGGWCPYCNTQLMELRHVIPDLAESGFDVLFLSNDGPGLLYEGLKQETKESIDGLGYTILSDADANAGRAFGTAFHVSDEYLKKLEDGDYNYEDSSIDRYQILAVPSVYLIDLSGEIAFAYANPNYKVRLDPEALVDAANSLSGNVAP